MAYHKERPIELDRKLVSIRLRELDDLLDYVNDDDGMLKHLYAFVMDEPVPSDALGKGRFSEMLGKLIYLIGDADAGRGARRGGEAREPDEEERSVAGGDGEACRRDAGVGVHVLPRRQDAEREGREEAQEGPQVQLGRPAGALTDEEFSREVSTIARALGNAIGTMEGLELCGAVDRADTTLYSAAERALGSVIADRYAGRRACEGLT